MNKEEVLQNAKDYINEGEPVCDVFEIISETELQEHEKSEIIDEINLWLDKQSENEWDRFVEQQGRDDPLYSQTVVRTWGTPELDKKFTHIEDHHLIVFEGAQGQGKTTFTDFVASKNAEKMKVLYFSLEMSPEELITNKSRKKSGITKEEWNKRNNGMIPENKKQLYLKYKQEIKDNKNLVYESQKYNEDPTLEFIFNKIELHNPKLVFIDNMGDIVTEEKDEIKREKKIINELLQFCKHKRTPIILLHHLNKAGDTLGSVRIKTKPNQIYRIERDKAVKEGNATPAEFARSYILEMKDRDWAQFEVGMVYFEKGTFVDNMSSHTLDQSFL